MSTPGLIAGWKADHGCRAKERFAWGKSDILLNLRAFDATRDIRGYAALRSFCEEVRPFLR